MNFKVTKVIGRWQRQRKKEMGDLGVQWQRETETVSHRETERR